VVLKGGFFFLAIAGGWLMVQGIVRVLDRSLGMEYFQRNDTHQYC